MERAAARELVADGMYGDGVPAGERSGGPGEVRLTNLDEPLFDDAEATKRDLVDYLEAVGEQLLGELRDRPLSVIRALRGQKPFMQKNVPKYTPPWVRTVKIWADRSKRDVAYALCNDRPTLLWFANQRAVEYHPTLVRLDPPDHPQTHLVLDIDPPAGAPFDAVVRTAELVRQALAEAGLAGAVKTSGAKGVHVFVPVAQPATSEAIAAATRALAARAERIDPALATTAYVVADRAGKVFIDATRAGGATIVAAYSPRIRPGAPVSFPVPWDELAGVVPTDFTIRTVPALVGTGNPWAAQLPGPQPLPAELIEEGRAIPIARVAAMHEGKRRARARDRHPD
jgi:DNA ligase D-like protein (predicted polymerase)